MAGNEPDALANAFKDAADKKARKDLAKTQKRLSAAERDKLAKDKNFTNKRLKAEEN